MKTIAVAASLALAPCGPAKAGFVVALALEPSEPAVFAMMLLGLCLVSYRVSRDSGEKIK